MNGYIAVPRATISAHRLWTNLWMRLGQAWDNPRKPGGNRQPNGSGQPGVHRTGAAAFRPATGAVDTRTRAGLLGRQISPASTDPMTTTFLYSNDIPSTKQAARAISRATRWHVPRTGGSFA